MRTARPYRPLRTAFGRVLVLAAIYAVFMYALSASIGDIALASGAIFAALLAFGCLLHWRDIRDALRGRRAARHSRHSV